MSSPTTLRLVLVLGALALLAPPMAAGEATTVSGQQPVNADWTIEEGETLTVKPGTTFRGEGRLIVKGLLEIEGTRERPATFRIPIVVAGGEVTGRHATFEPAGDVAVALTTGRLDLADVTFRNAAVGVRVVGNPNEVHIERANFHNSRNVALSLNGGGDLHVANSHFRGNGADVSINFDRASGARYEFSNNVFESRQGSISVIIDDPLSPAIRTLHLGGNKFVGMGAPSSDLSTAAILIAGRLAEEPIGMPPSIGLTGNAIQNHGVGIHLRDQGFDFESEADMITGNRVGIIVEGVDGARFVRTLFANSQWDIQSSGVESRIVLAGAIFDPDRVYFLQSDVIVVDGSPLPYVAGGVVALGILGALGLVLTNAGWDLLQRFLVTPLYTRLTPSDIVQNEKRSSILGYLNDVPGAHLRRIGQALDMSYGTLTYHVYRLEKEGYITSSSQGVFKRYFPSARRLKTRSAEQPFETELSGPERTIYEFIAENPGATQSNVAKSLGLSRQALHYHVKKLEKRGHVRKVSQGRETLCFANGGADVSSGIASGASA